MCPAGIGAQQMFAQQLKEKMGPEPSPVCVQGNAGLRRWAKGKILQSTKFINAACYVTFLEILGVLLAYERHWEVLQ